MDETDIVLPEWSESEEILQQTEHAPTDEVQDQTDDIQIGQKTMNTDVLETEIKEEYVEDDGDSREENYTEKEMAEILMAVDQSSNSIPSDPESEYSLEILDLMQEKATNLQAGITDPIIDRNVVPVTQIIPSHGISQTQEENSKISPKTYLISRPVIKGQLQLQTVAKPPTVQSTVITDPVIRRNVVPVIKIIPNHGISQTQVENLKISPKPHLNSRPVVKGQLQLQTVAKQPRFQNTVITDPVVNSHNVVPLSRGMTETQKVKRIKVATISRKTHYIRRTVVKKEPQLQTIANQPNIELIQSASKALPQTAASISSAASPASQTETTTSASEQPFILHSLAQPLTGESVSSIPSTQADSSQFQIVTHPTQMIHETDHETFTKIKSDNVTAEETTAVMGKPPQCRFVTQTVNTMTEKTNTTPASDDLATLATAALACEQHNVSSTTKVPQKEPVWCDVGIFKTSSCHVNSYYEPNHSHDQDHKLITTDSLPDFSNSCTIKLEPGTAYKFRVAAINSCGIGPWSEVSTFRTSLPGYPEAPSSIKISKSAAGAHLSWEPPSNPTGNIDEYSVSLAVRNTTHPQMDNTPHKLTFVRVYSGPYNHAVIPQKILSTAYIDLRSKPAIILRIAAKNEKGFGPATQVRWLQDVVAAPVARIKTLLPKKETIPKIVQIK